MTTVFLALYLGKEFIDWAWWYHWEDEDDEPNLAPFLCSIWRVSHWLEVGCSRLWWRVRIPWERHRGRFCPPEVPDPPSDQDGRTPEEWLLIESLGVWNLDSYRDDYDQQVKKNWDEFLRTRAWGGEEQANTVQEAGP